MGGSLQRCQRAHGAGRLDATLGCGLGMAGSSLLVIGNALRLSAAAGEQPRHPQSPRPLHEDALSIGETAMEIVYLLIPLSVVLVFAIIGLFWWALQAGQFDNIEREGERILKGD
jgi:cbb3-type cytochrome oxidase maturation protein